MLFKKDGNAPKTALAASCEPKADSLFAKIEKEYLKLKAEAARYPKSLSIPTERKTGNVWYVPGGQSTIGILLKDANARYIFEDDEHSGSLAMSSEQILAKGKQVDIWAFKFFGGAPLSQTQLLQNMTATRLLLPSAGVISIGRYLYGTLFRTYKFPSRTATQRVHHPGSWRAVRQIEIL